MLDRTVFWQRFQRLDAIPLTARPTAELILQAFKEINRITVTVGSQVYFQVGQLSPLQQEILILLEIPEEIYTQLVGEFRLVS